MMEVAMSVVIVEMQAGHSVEEKRQLAKDMTQALVKMGEPVEDIQVIMRETPTSCWAQAGKLCSDWEIPPGA
jgi:4-oxalocrotonate tautomerase family enzyme